MMLETFNYFILNFNAPMQPAVSDYISPVEAIDAKEQYTVSDNNYYSILQ